MHVIHCSMSESHHYSGLTGKLPRGFQGHLEVRAPETKGTCRPRPQRGSWRPLPAPTLIAQGPGGGAPAPTWCCRRPHPPPAFHQRASGSRRRFPNCAGDARARTPGFRGGRGDECSRRQVRPPPGEASDRLFPVCGDTCWPCAELQPSAPTTWASQ